MAPRGLHSRAAHSVLAAALLLAACQPATPTPTPTATLTPTPAYRFRPGLYFGSGTGLLGLSFEVTQDERIVAFTVQMLTGTQYCNLSMESGEAVVIEPDGTFGATSSDDPGEAAAALSFAGRFISPTEVEAEFGPMVSCGGQASYVIGDRSWTAHYADADATATARAGAPSASAAPTETAVVIPTGTPLVDLTDQLLLAEIQATESVTEMAFSSDGSLIALGLNNGDVEVWQPLGTGPERILSGHAAPISAMGFSSDGRFLATASRAEYLDARIWDTRTWEVRSEVTADDPDGTVTSLDLSYDGTMLVTASADGGIRIWQSPGGAWLRGMNQWVDPVSRVRFSSDARLIGATSGTGIRTWRSHDGEPVDMLGVLDAEGELIDVAFGDGEVMAGVLQTPDGTSIYTWPGAQGAMYDSFALDGFDVAVLSADGRLAAAGSPDGDVGFWARADAALLGAAVHPGVVSELVFAPDGAMLASASGDTVRIWSNPSAR